MTVTRFAPSPSGYLHTGHAFAALFAERAAREADGRFLLRIEDIDRARARPEFLDAILEDLRWLGLAWETPIRVQSEHFADYAVALARLDAMDVLYPCFCTRRDIAEEIARSIAAPHGPDGPLYPGTCRRLARNEAAARVNAGETHALRLDMHAALARIGGPLTFVEKGAGPAGENGEIAARPEMFGDVVLARKDTPASYHLCVVHDDALQGVTLVTRGNDLFLATHLHRLLQALLDLPAPEYRHHALVTDERGRRLAKRDRARTLRELRAEGLSPAALRAQLGFAPL